MIYDVKDIDLTRSLPAPLRNDETELAIARAIAEQLQLNAKFADRAVIYARIDELEENIVDALAEDMHVDWYYPDAPLSVKRQLVKESVEVHKHLGTPWAVKRVVAAYFDESEVTEWFDYGGEPGYFRIFAKNEVPYKEVYERFLSLLEKVKRKSAWLESITISTEMPPTIGQVGGLIEVAPSTKIPRAAIDTDVPFYGELNGGGAVYGAHSTRISRTPINTQISIRGAPINYGSLSENAESTKISRVPYDTSTPMPPTVISGGGISESNESTALSRADIFSATPFNFEAVRGGGSFAQTANSSRLGRLTVDKRVTPISGELNSVGAVGQSATQSKLRKLTADKQVTPISGNANLGGSFAQSANSVRLGRLTVDKQVTPFGGNLNSGGAVGQSATQSKLRKLTADKQVTPMNGNANLGGDFVQTANSAKLGRLTVDKSVTLIGGELNSGGAVGQSATQSKLRKLTADKKVTPMNGNANLGGSFAQTANSAKLGRLTANKSVTLLSTVWYMGGVTLTSTSTRLSEPMQITEDGYVLTDSGAVEPAIIMVDGGEYPLSLSL
jgi:phage tail P2-like protein